MKGREYRVFVPLEVLARIYNYHWFPEEADGWSVPLTRTWLCRNIYPHPKRPYQVDAKRFYGVMIPFLVKAGLAREVRRERKPSAFAFRLPPAADALKLLDDSGSQRLAFGHDPRLAKEAYSSYRAALVIASLVCPSHPMASCWRFWSDGPYTDA